MFVYILMGGIFILSLIVQNSLKSKFAKYSKVPLGVPMAGRDVAIAMLQQNGCGDVQVTSVSGQLTATASLLPQWLLTSAAMPFSTRWATACCSCAPRWCPWSPLPLTR